MEDIRYTVELIKKINTLTKDGIQLSTYFHEDAYSLWSFQQSFLVTQVKEYSTTRNFNTFIKRRISRLGLLGSLFKAGFNTIVIGITLLGVASTFFRKITVVTFSSDFLNADKKPTPRLRNIYNFFEKEKVSFIEILHITSTRSFFKNLPQRSHLGVYFEAFTLCAYIGTLFSRRRIIQKFIQGMDFSSFEGEEKRFVQYVVREAVLKIVVQKNSVVLLEWFFKLVRAKAFVSVDDFRYVPLLMLACERVSTPTHVFQHSNFGWLPSMYLLAPDAYIFPTKFYTWNTYWTLRVKEISPYFNHYASRISVGGRSFTPLQPPVVERDEPTKEKESIKVLIPYEVSLTSEYIQPYIEQMLSDTRITILFVLRGTIDQIDHTMQIHQYVPVRERGNPRFVVVDPKNRENAIRACDVIAGVYSGFLDESVETGVPICIFETPFFYVNRLDTDNLASLIDISKGDLFEQFVTAYKTPNTILKKRRERVTEGSMNIDVTLAKIVAG